MQQPLPSSEPAPIRHRRTILNRWSMLGLIVFSAGIIALFVSNVIAVNQLLDENHALREELERVSHQNKHLYEQVVQLQSPERIASFARTHLGLVQSVVPPKRIRRSAE